MNDQRPWVGLHGADNSSQPCTVCEYSLLEEMSIKCPSVHPPHVPVPPPPAGRRWRAARPEHRGGAAQTAACLWTQLFIWRLCRAEAAGHFPSCEASYGGSFDIYYVYNMKKVEPDGCWMLNKCSNHLTKQQTQLTKLHESALFCSLQTHYQAQEDVRITLWNIKKVRYQALWHICSYIYTLL